MIPIKLTLSQAWELFKKNWKFLLVVTIIGWIFQGLPRSFGQRNYANDSWLLSVLLGLVFSILKIIVDIGLTKIYLKMVDKEPAKIEDLFAHYKLFWKYLAGSILYGLIVVGGLLLLIVPGIIWAVKFQFYAYLIVDKNLGPLQALSRSSEVTQGKKWALFKFNLVNGLVAVSGIFALGVGLLITVPVTQLSMAMLYRKLSPEA